MDVLERIEILIALEKVSKRELSEKCAMKPDRWKNVLGKKAKLYQEDMEALYKLWPEYKYWLTFGIEEPEKGQISPMTKKATRS